MSKTISFTILLFLQTHLFAQQFTALSNTPSQSAIQAVGHATTGTGVYGQGGISGISGFTTTNGGYGVYGQTTFMLGAGIYGTGQRTGVHGVSTGAFGVGVKGEGNTMSGRGVFGITNQSTGTGVYGEATVPGGTAVYGDAPGGFAIAGLSSGDGWAGSFSGGKGVFIEPRLGVNAANPEYPIQVGAFNGPPGNGAHVTTGGIWTNGSSKWLKKEFTAVDPQQILHQLNQLNISTWKYRNGDEGTHLGPMAEDFFAAFQLGNDDRYIPTLDADGVAFAAIQALSEKIDQQGQLIKEQEKIIALLINHAKMSKKNQKQIVVEESFNSYLKIR